MKSDTRHLVDAHLKFGLDGLASDGFDGQEKQYPSVRDNQGQQIDITKVHRDKGQQIHEIGEADADEDPIIGMMPTGPDRELADTWPLKMRPMISNIMVEYFTLTSQLL